MVVRTRGGLHDAWTYRRYAVDGLWAYQPIAKIEPPRADAHPVDAFVDARLADAGLEVASRADKLDLLRRVTFALTGLPPSPAEVKAFLEDKRPESKRCITRGKRSATSPMPSRSTTAPRVWR